MDINSFYEKAAGFVPNPLQKAVWDTYLKADGHPSLLFRAGTGQGKTEAVLFPALADRNPQRRIILVLPSKALIEDMGERIRCIGARLSSSAMSDLDITMDMGGSCRRFQCQGGTVEASTYYRHLFADDIILTTLDKFLFRVFGYGEKIKSFIFPHRVFGSTLGKKPFVVFDEAHEYDGLAFSNFIRLLEALYIKGKDLCVMSATLPPRFADFLKTVDTTSGELGRRQAAATRDRIRCSDKKLTLIDPKRRAGETAAEEKDRLESQAASYDPEKPSSRLVSTIAEQVRRRYSSSRRIIARTEYVSDLISLHSELQDLAPFIYHGRMTSYQRRNTVQDLIQRQKNEKGFLVLATSAIEAGCDLDAHVIVTELCNPDGLVQLAGRLNRRGLTTDAELVVVGNRLKPGLAVLSGGQIENYLQDLSAMDGMFAAEGLEKYFHPPEGDWMGEILFDMLWEYVYEGDLSAKPLWDRGILVTRSWEPSVTLCTGFDSHERPQNSIQVGISRLSKRISRTPKNDENEEPYKDWLKKQQVREKFSITKENGWHADLFRAFYNPGNPEESRWKLTEMKGNYLSGYESNLICRIKPQFSARYFDNFLGYVDLPVIFLKGYRDGHKQFLDYHPEFSKDGRFSIPSSQSFPKHAGRVWYLER